MSPMKGIRVDPQRRTVRAEGGVLWRELDRETQVFGLATTGGTVSNTGIAGLTLGGGLGWLMGKHGLTIDNLISADVVTADGTFRQASATDNPDLFWALRGGGGNFGVVTSFEYRLHPVTQVLGGLVLYPLDQAHCGTSVLPRFLPIAARRGRSVRRTADGSARDAGRRVAAWLQRINRGRRKILGPARRFGTPLADLVGPIPYTARQTMLDAPNAEHGLHRYWRSAFTEQISDGLIDAAVEGAAALHVAAQCADLLLHARRRHASAARRDGICRPPSAMGFRCDRSVGRRCHVRTAHRMGAGALDPAASRTCSARCTSTTWPPMIALRSFERPSARTTRVFDR